MTASTVPGLECAGVVAGVGADVTRWKIGDRVCALLFDGGYAEYAVAPAVQSPWVYAFDGGTGALVGSRGRCVRQ